MSSLDPSLSESNLLDESNKGKITFLKDNYRNTDN